MTVINGARTSLAGPQRGGSRVRRIPPNLFRIAFGLSGLGEAWQAAGPDPGGPEPDEEGTDLMGGASMRTGFTQEDARDDFDRARRRAYWAKLAGWLRGRPSSRNRLPVLGKVPAATGAGGAGPGAQRLEFEPGGRLGTASQAMVPISQIVGTVEPRTYFDRRFRPTSEQPRSRFERVAAAVLSGRGMEPVDLYHCGGRYYVLDGHHRIAVARALGERSVWANVTEVHLNQPGPPTTA